MGNTKATTVTVKGQVTLPKSVREAAGIRPGDRVVARALPTGGVLVERSAPAEPDPAALAAARKRIEDAVAELYRRGVKFEMTTDELMAMTRGED
ncbi:MAG: AbrB/MazE/SpoVT family DNA-binding domain-containing protein [Rhodoblastus sp.]|nr:AbrB/MazE/SpoVT family DNA-binding domain-containing protein [Rhodoblastus sp.]